MQEPAYRLLGTFVDTGHAVLRWMIHDQLLRHSDLEAEQSLMGVGHGPWDESSQSSQIDRRADLAEFA